MALWMSYGEMNARMDTGAKCYAEEVYSLDDMLNLRVRIWSDSHFRSYMIEDKVNCRILWTLNADVVNSHNPEWRPNEAFNCDVIRQSAE